MTKDVTFISILSRSNVPKCSKKVDPNFRRVRSKATIIIPILCVRRRALSSPFFHYQVISWIWSSLKTGILSSFISKAHINKGRPRKVNVLPALLVNVSLTQRSYTPWGKVECMVWASLPIAKTPAKKEWKNQVHARADGKGNYSQVYCGRFQEETQLLLLPESWKDPLQILKPLTASNTIQMYQP